MNHETLLSLNRVRWTPTSAVAASLGLSLGGARYHLAQAERRGLVERRMRDRNLVWRLADPPQPIRVNDEHVAAGVVRDLIGVNPPLSGQQMLDLVRAAYWRAASSSGTDNAPWWARERL